MLLDLSEKEYFSRFTQAPHFFVSRGFLNTVVTKTEEIKYLVHEKSPYRIGLVLGVDNHSLTSPFSAPFGGFHYAHNKLYSTDIDTFIQDLQLYMLKHNYNSFSLTLPPAPHEQSNDIKVLNSLLRHGAELAPPGLHCFVDLREFQGVFQYGTSRAHSRQGEREGVVIYACTTLEEKEQSFSIIAQNRKAHGYPLYMNFDEVLEIEKHCMVDWWIVQHPLRGAIGAAIIYRISETIAYLTFWGDINEGRAVKAMDVLSLKLLQYYKEQGVIFFDMGIATEDGVPNPGLLRFKETHEAKVVPRYSLVWQQSHFKEL